MKHQMLALVGHTIEHQVLSLSVIVALVLLLVATFLVAPFLRR